MQIGKVLIEHPNVREPGVFKPAPLNLICLMMSFVMHSQVPPLSSFIGTLGTLKRRRFTPALQTFVPPHSTLPSIAFPAEPAAEFTLLTGLVSG